MAYIFLMVFSLLSGYIYKGTNKKPGQSASIIKEVYGNLQIK